MAITVAYDLEAYQFDAVNTFINSYIDEIVYIEYSDGFKKGSNCLLLF